MSLRFLPLHFRFSSLHLLEDSFIRIPFPFRSRCPVLHVLPLHFPASWFLSSALLICVQFL